MFVILFNSLIFTSFDIYHYYHSCLASKLLPALSESTRSFLRSYFIQFSPVLSFLSLIRLETITVSFLSFILGLFYVRFPFNFSYLFLRNACVCIFSSHHMFHWYCNEKTTLIKYGACGWSQRTPTVGTRQWEVLVRTLFRPILLEF